MISAIYWDPKPEIFSLPWVDWPILWYGVFFALGFAIGFPLFVSIVVRFFRLRPATRSTDKSTLRKKAVAITDRLTIYVVIGTVVGARLGHFLFYERPSAYFRDPLEIFRIWEGGLASHGGVIGIVLAVIFFRLRTRKEFPDLTALRLLDFIAIPAALGSAFIRLGNFFNQEILGKPTDLPWAVIFGHPADLSAPIPRHPVQLYEALFYLALFFILWRLSYLPRFLLSRGKLAGLLLVCIFAFRFFIEYFKEEQSRLLGGAFPLTMGQILSLPVIGLGVLFYFWQKKN